MIMLSNNNDFAQADIPFVMKLKERDQIYK